MLDRLDRGRLRRARRSRDRPCWHQYQGADAQYGQSTFHDLFPHLRNRLPRWLQPSAMPGIPARLRERPSTPAPGHACRSASSRVGRGKPTAPRPEVLRPGEQCHMLDRDKRPSRRRCISILRHESAAARYRSPGRRSKADIACCAAPGCDRLQTKPQAQPGRMSPSGEPGVRGGRAGAVCAGRGCRA